MKRTPRSGFSAVLQAAVVALFLGLLTPWAVWQLLPPQTRELSLNYLWPLWPYLFALLAGLLAGRFGREGGLRLGLWGGLLTGTPLLWLAHPAGTGVSRWGLEILAAVLAGMLGGVWGVNR